MLLGHRLPLPHGQLGAIVWEQQTAAGNACRWVHGRFSMSRASPGRHTVEARRFPELSYIGRARRGKGAYRHWRGR